MKNRLLYATVCILAGSAFFMASPVVWSAANFDEEAAKTLLDDNECTKCHTVSKTKKGPSYQKIAKKYKGKADAEATLMKHLTTGPKVKLEDGSQEDHKIIETKDEAQIKNLIRWILSL